MTHKPDAVELKLLKNELRGAAWKKRFPGYQASIEGYLDSDCAPSPANYAAIERKRSFDEDFDAVNEAFSTWSRGQVGKQVIHEKTWKCDECCDFGYDLVPGDGFGGLVELPCSKGCERKEITW